VHELVESADKVDDAAASDPVIAAGNGADGAVMCSATASLINDARAPIWRASMICWVLMVLVSRMILTEGEPFMMARMASMPGRRGI